MSSQKTIKRFWKAVDVRGSEECWPWKKGKFSNGYGAFSIADNRTVRAHRFSFELAFRALSEKEIVRHKCDNKPCCNPRHLLAGNSQDNVNDKIERNRQAKGETVNTAKLSTAQVIKIRKDPRSQRAIAKSYGVCKSSIANIQTKKTWKHI